MSTVLTADPVVVLDTGRVVGKGTHQELSRSTPAYRRLVTTHLTGSNPRNRGRPRQGLRRAPQALYPIGAGDSALLTATVGEEPLTLTLGPAKFRRGTWYVSATWQR